MLPISNATVVVVDSAASCVKSTWYFEPESPSETLQLASGYQELI
jgi:hypothetical protein